MFMYIICYGVKPPFNNKYDFAHLPIDETRYISYFSHYYIIYIIIIILHKHPLHYYTFYKLN